MSAKDDESTHEPQADVSELLLTEKSLIFDVELEAGKRVVATKKLVVALNTEKLDGERT